MPKPFASSADLADKEATLEQLVDGVYAYTAQGDPNVGCIVGADAILAIEARATPFMARQWIDVIRERISDLPFDDLVLTHYHAVRVLGAAAFEARRIVAHANTRALIEERGQQDWASEAGRMPRLFQGAETIPGLTHPTDTFDDALTLDLGNRTVELRYLGRGHTSGDLVVWLPDERICFAGDLVEAQAAPYMGDAHIGDWSTSTLDNVAALKVRERTLVGYRGYVKTWLIPHLGRHRLDKLKPDHVRALYAAMEADGKSDATRRQAHAILRRALVVAECLLEVGLGDLADGQERTAVGGPGT